MGTKPPKEPYRQQSPMPGCRQALLTCYVGHSQLQHVEWIPEHIQVKAQVRVGRDDRVWVVEEIY